MQGLAVYQQQMMQYYQMAQNACDSSSQSRHFKDASNLFKIHQHLSACAFAAQQVAAQHFQNMVQNTTPAKSQQISSKSGSSEKQIAPESFLMKPAKLTNI